MALAAMVLLACSKTPSSGPGHEASGKGQKSRPQPVVTTQTRLEDVPLRIEAQGSLIALDEVELRPQKNGALKEVLVTEGSEVRRGQLLFTLDDRDDKANVEKAEAVLTSARAALAIARLDLDRAQDLSARNFISPSALDTARNKADTAEAALAQSRAALEQARVALSYNRISAPFDGRAGRVDIRPGALTTSNASSPALVKITRMNPIGVSFALPERELPNLLAAQKAAPVKALVFVDEQTRLQGLISFIDSSVDRGSGTIAVKARLDNADHRAWPGQYVKVKLEAGESRNVVVLPAQALINGPAGRMVYVVQPDSRVRAQPVELLRIFEQKAVVRGVDAGLRIVQEGAQNLRPGALVVEIRNKPKQSGNGAGAKP